MADVFLSYASEDRERVRPLVDAIERAGSPAQGGAPQCDREERLALNHITAKWKSPPIYWHAAKTQFAIRFGDRFAIVD